jgi:hypothetical protein
MPMKTRKTGTRKSAAKYGRAEATENTFCPRSKGRPHRTQHIASGSFVRLHSGQFKVNSPLDRKRYNVVIFARPLPYLQNMIIQIDAGRLREHKTAGLWHMIQERQEKRQKDYYSKQN